MVWWIVGAVGAVLLVLAVGWAWRALADLRDIFNAGQ